MIIRIGAIDYEYIEARDLRNTDGEKMNGLINHNDCTIQVEVSLSEQAKRQTTWHEIVHGILNNAGSPRKWDHETLCDVIAYGIMAVLRDNPWLGLAETPCATD